VNGGPLPPPTPRAAPSPARPATSAPAWRWIGLAGAVGLAVGSLLPWASVTSLFGQIDVAGTDGDGKYTLVLGLVAALGFVMRRWIVGGACAALGAGICVYDMIRLNNRISDLDDELLVASIGFGLYVAVAGGVVAVLAAVVGRSRL